VRIKNLTLPDGDETDTTLVMETVYNKALLPILKGALHSKLIKKILEAHELLETAHILLAKNNNRPKPETCVHSFSASNVNLPPPQPPLLTPPPLPSTTLWDVCGISD
jgi:hypothetical protein